MTALQRGKVDKGRAAPSGVVLQGRVQAECPDRLPEVSEGFQFADQRPEQGFMAWARVVEDTNKCGTGQFGPPLAAGQRRPGEVVLVVGILAVIRAVEVGRSLGERSCGVGETTEQEVEIGVGLPQRLQQSVVPSLSVQGNQDCGEAELLGGSAVDFLLQEYA